MILAPDDPRYEAAIDAADSAYGPLVRSKGRDVAIRGAAEAFLSSLASADPPVVLAQYAVDKNQTVRLVPASRSPEKST